MAKRKTVPAPTGEQLKVIALQRFDTDRTSPQVVPQPTRTFAIGEQVLLGALDNVIVVQILHDNKAYLVSHDTRPNRAKTGDLTPITTDYMVRWWFEIEKFDARPNNVPVLFDPYERVHLSSGELEGMFFKMSNGGLVCDGEYQRGYVWTDDDRTALLDSVFERLEIGSVTVVRHHGYLHEGSTETKQYITLDGQEVQVARNDDYTTAIIDGQQRLTTLFNFFTDRFTYRGKLYSQMHFRDQVDFLQTRLTYRLFEEDQIDKKTILRIFLQCNRGVPQSREHIAKVQALYDSM